MSSSQMAVRCWRAGRWIKPHGSYMEFDHWLVHSGVLICRGMGSVLMFNHSRAKESQDLIPGITFAPSLWTSRNTTILAAFAFMADDAMTLHDASTLNTVGAPFEWHTKAIPGLALSFDGALLTSASDDATIKLWAVGSHQLLPRSTFRIPIFLSPHLAHAK
ncbi:uncharacterized protein EDB91DRAFT_551727 [Suillus paluster]|uniref:uncharacterized protein n=1 Tax=Suillus paluster TaxID=48578 RepID=UPI001B886DCF|nr:uncharacterized protein EDB91DRAFT_551727 [Suillus paluster]KAG1735731.1 hypothetical protein EDB91DRAFT_551727 [Suillus paluster]